MSIPSGPARRGRCLAALLGAALLALPGCRSSPEDVQPSIELTQVPPAGEGGPDALVPIAGTVRGARAGQQVVLFTRSGVWWVQPFAAHPFTPIAPDGTWKSTIHIGTEYAALLVAADYHPATTVDALPPLGAGVLAIATAKGTGTYTPRVARTVAFSGYDWELRHAPSDRGGANEYDPANAWVDADGFLHLKLARRPDGTWTSAEVRLTRALGYGTYTFVVRDVSHLDPAAVLGLLTWDDEGAEQNHRELDVEISRWGDAAIANAQYVIQPYYVAANVVRFTAPPGRLTYSFRWEPGQASFRTVRGGGPSPGAVVSSHVFTAGVPVPGNERVHMNLYFFRYSSVAVQKEVEVVIERFQYFP